MKTVILLAILLSLSACSYVKANEIYACQNNTLFYDLNAEGIGVLGNWVDLPNNIQVSNVAMMRVLAMFTYGESEIPHYAIVDGVPSNGDSMILVELTDVQGKSLGLLVVYNPIVGLQTPECLVVSRSEERVPMTH